MDGINVFGKKVLVTGGNGYLGKHLVQRLKQMGAKVSVIDRNASGEDQYPVDLTEAGKVLDIVQEIRPDFIVHLAALLDRDRSFSNHDQIMAVNYTGTINLLRALDGITYENFIFTSTSEVYGSNQAPFQEDQRPAPPSPYSMSKTFAEIAIRNYSFQVSRPYTILRLFNFIGKDMPQQFFIPQLIHALKNENVFNMTAGEQARDFLHVEDIVQSILLSIAKQEARNETFNVSSNISVTLKELVTTCQSLIPGSCPIAFGALPYRDNEIWNMVGDNSKIVNRLGFRVNYSISDIFKEII